MAGLITSRPAFVTPAGCGCCFQNHLAPRIELTPANRNGAAVERVPLTRDTNTSLTQDADFQGILFHRPHRHPHLVAGLGTGVVPDRQPERQRLGSSHIRER